MTHKYLITTLALLLTFGIYAQETGESKLGTWLEVTSSNRLSEKLSLSASYTNWNYEGFKNYQLRLGLIGLAYRFNAKTTAGIGYGYGNIDTTFENNGIPIIKEHRLFEFATFKHKSYDIAWSHRLKLEHRFLDRQTSNDLIHRIRYRFKGTLPINQLFFISVYDEIHFNLNPFDFQQNRAFGGLGYKVNKNSNLIFGYARHSFKTKSFNRLSIQLNLKYDFRKQEN